jgi:hypothetical protein
MKNIHLLPTNPNDETGGGIWVKKTRDWCNIYITSNENLKEGDWVLIPTNDVIQWAKVFRPDGEKIILTTDPYLISDGTQAIDDEFLEWFVKNPSCKEVEVKHFGTCCGNQSITQCINCEKYNPIYKIIIQQV